MVANCIIYISYDSCFWIKFNISTTCKQTYQIKVLNILIMMMMMEMMMAKMMDDNNGVS